MLSELDRDQNFFKESIILMQEKNLLFLKMFNNSKSLIQMIESNSGNLKEMFKEILILVCDLKKIAIIRFGMMKDVQSKIFSGGMINGLF